MRPLLACIPVLLACAAEPAGGPVGETPLHTSGSFAGHYDVPTSPELRAAARYAVDHIDWTVTGDTATLHYELPVGLVGGEVEVTLTGPIDRATNTATVTGHVGIGTCSIDGSIVTCHERFENLGALPISVAVVDARARLEYAGPVQHRIAIAHMFASEPLGIAIFDLQTPSTDDSHDDSKPDED